MVCSYGCGRDALFTLSNGKYCCVDNWRRCPEVRRKNSENVKQNRKYEKENGIVRRWNNSVKKSECEFCKKLFNIRRLEVHKRMCYLNPSNLKLCPICETPIKDYRRQTTCSQKCAQIYFRDMFDEIRANRDMSWVSDLYDGPVNPYVSICFKYHEKKCIICGEDIIVAVHHYDNDKTNNDPRNLVPLCPTHHIYIHSTIENMYYIKECVDEYVNKFSLNYSRVD